jgi:hypothetical protein
MPKERLQSFLDELCQGDPESQNLFADHLDKLDEHFDSDDEVGIVEVFESGLKANLNMPLVVQRLAERREVPVEDIAERVFTLTDGKHEHRPAHHERALA